jgi:CheY-like chemotaxis protein/CHASE3 domain sensor protein
MNSSPSPSRSLFSQARSRLRSPLPPRTFAAFSTATAVVVLIALLSYGTLQSRSASAGLVAHTLDVIAKIEAFLSSVKDAETGQRGYLLTGAESYLEPYSLARAALPGQLEALRAATADNPVQRARADTLSHLVTDKLDELAETITMRRAGNDQAALAMVRTNRGRSSMTRIREIADDMRNDEQAQLAARQKEWTDATWLSSLISWAGSALLLFLIATAAVMSSREHRERETNTWLRSGQLGLAARIQGEQRLEVLAANVLDFLVDYLDAQVGVLYVVQPDGSFLRQASHALAATDDGRLVRTGDGLLGQVVKDQRPLHVRDLPKDYFKVSSASGSARPAELLLAPATVDGLIYGVIELGFFRRVDRNDEELLARVAETLGVVVRAAQDRSRLEALLEETQRQGEELQAQQEELRVNNEELEEQSRALRTSQAQLEEQQAELEQTNSQLEEQAQMLENQKEELSVSHAHLLEKADELERSNQHKSEFLANMSHELRTPLNSTLILSKLLADNKAGNLTPEQVKFAQTISSAGNDLLYLINDVLDLAKIEAGKVELNVETVEVTRLLESLASTMRPQAAQRGLAFSVERASDAAERIETDGERLSQILRNLVSNALKFTKTGSVSVHAVAAEQGGVAFEVRDTGIGIEPHQLGLIFEAFQQADGSTHRKYGGTGLGLSISRDLAHLLGGEITVQSTPGEGSCFTLSLPSSAPAVVQAPKTDWPEKPEKAMPPVRHPLPSARQRAAATMPAAAPGAALAPPTMEDDRHGLLPNRRLILVIEDDLRFAAILRDLVREMGFQCIVTATAADGLAATSAFQPSAILLDMNLPDHSGLSVLDQLKRNSATRHIPVHVTSVADYAREALELGAIGYALKPVKREQLVDALQRLETTFTQRLRRVLVVEDDARQRESIRELLSNPAVDITVCERAGDALALLQQTTFDCMVMDLNLPDLSGYQLLEKMALEEGVAFPPVIVYTGHSLTRDEEQRLRRFSRSIIVKDVRSPERLLDEVTLFLHQVEAELPPESQRLLKVAREREAALEGRRILIVEDDVRNIFALTSVLEPRGVLLQIARNGREAIEALAATRGHADEAIDLVLMDIMMPEMDGYTATREIRKHPEWKKLPIIALTAKAMKDDHEKCIAAGANDYIAKPLDVEKLLSLVRVWMPK